MTAEVARRHHKPRYVPVKPNRGRVIDPVRVEHHHPSWCTCTRCTPPSPADRGGIGCALLGFFTTFAGGLAAVGLGVGAVSAIWGMHGVALIFGVTP